METNTRTRSQTLEVQYEVTMTGSAQDHICPAGTIKTALKGVLTFATQSLFFIFCISASASSAANLADSFSAIKRLTVALSLASSPLNSRFRRLHASSTYRVCASAIVAIAERMSCDRQQTMDIYRDRTCRLIGKSTDRLPKVQLVATAELDKHCWHWQIPEYQAIKNTRGSLVF